MVEELEDAVEWLESIDSECAPLRDQPRELPVMEDYDSLGKETIRASSTIQVMIVP